MYGGASYAVLSYGAWQAGVLAQRGLGFLTATLVNSSVISATLVNSATATASLVNSATLTDTL